MSRPEIERRNRPTLRAIVDALKAECDLSDNDVMEVRALLFHDETKQRFESWAFDAESARHHYPNLTDGQACDVARKAADIFGDCDLSDTVSTCFELALARCEIDPDVALGEPEDGTMEGACTEDPDGMHHVGCGCE